MDDAEEKKNTDYTGVIIAVVLLPVYFFVRHIENPDIALTVLICLGMYLLAIRLYWKRLRKRTWFWMVTAFILALHVPLILKVQWPHIWLSAVFLLPIGVAELLIYVGAIWLTGKFMTNDAPSEEET